MWGELENRVRDKVRLAEQAPAADKVMDLPGAVRRFVHPGMHLHVGHAYMRPNSAVYEICRQFWGKNPAFTISSLGFIANMVLLVYGNLARRLVTTFCGDSYPFPGPNRIYQEAYRDKRIEIENWTVLTMTQRLLAGAMGVEWLPTHSLLGSSMVEENGGNVRVLDEPGAGRLLMVRALRPDLTILHAWAADPAGNVLLMPPYAENVHAVFASRGGAIVTVERVVDTEFMKRHSHFVRVPGYLVNAVCPSPMGVHPSGASNLGMEEFDAYAEDEDFMQGLRQACRTEEGIKAWTGEWLHGCPSHDDYVTKLGHEKIWHLKGRAAADSWVSEMAAKASMVDTGGTASPVEMMIVAASRVIREKVKERDYRTILAGIGASNLAAWKAYYDLRREGADADLVAEVGFYGYTPRPSDPFIFNFRNFPTCTMVTDILTVLGSMVGAESSRCIGVLSAGQVDKHGNINSTKVPAMNLYLVGSGGACDVALGAREVVVTVPLDRLRCVDEVGYITAPGGRVRTVVTDMGIFEKPAGGDTLELTAFYRSRHGGDARAAVEEARSRCGWDVRPAPSLRAVEPPTPDELIDVRIFDPGRYFLGS